MMKDANSRLDDLELRLSEYHEWLTESVAQRDRLALDAAWGVEGSVQSLIVVAIGVGALYHYDPPWWGAVLIGLGMAAANLAVLMWSNARRMKEVERLAELPKWQSKW